MQAIVHYLASPAPTLTVGDLGQALFQPLDLTSPSAEGLAAQPTIKILSEIVRPLTSGLSGLLGTPAPAPQSDQAAPAAPGDIDELRTRLTQLQQTVVEQQAQIDALRTAPGGRRR